MKGKWKDFLKHMFIHYDEAFPLQSFFFFVVVVVYLFTHFCFVTLTLRLTYIWKKNIGHYFGMVSDMLSYFAWLFLLKRPFHGS